jgi:Fic family protein
VRVQGDWEAWLEFFMEGVIESARGAVQAAQRLSQIAAADRDHIRGPGRGSLTLLEVQRCLQEHPVTTVTQMAKRASVTFATATRALATLEEMGIARETTGRKRNRVFSYERYLRVLSEGTEPL